MTKALSAAAQRAIEQRANHELALLRHVEEVSGNIAASCRYYGVSRHHSAIERSATGGRYLVSGEPARFRAPASTVGAHPGPAGRAWI